MIPFDPIQCRRLALDRCFPQVVLQRNSWRGTHHIAIFGFFVVASSLLMILDGDVEAVIKRDIADNKVFIYMKVRWQKA